MANQLDPRMLGAAIESYRSLESKLDDLPSGNPYLISHSPAKYLNAKATALSFAKRKLESTPFRAFAGATPIVTKSQHPAELDYFTSQIFGEEFCIVSSVQVSPLSRNLDFHVTMQLKDELKQVFVKLYDWQKNKLNKIFFQRDTAILPALSEIGCPVPHCYGFTSENSKGALAMQLYTGFDLEIESAKLKATERMKKITAAIKAQVRLMYVGTHNAPELLEKIGSIPLDKTTEDYFIEQFLKASERITGKRLRNKNSLENYYKEASASLAKQKKYFVHQDFKPANVLDTTEADIIITDVEHSSIPSPNFGATGGPLTLDYSVFCLWPDLKLNDKQRTRLDLFYLKECQKYEPLLTRMQFENVKQKTHLFAAKRFAGVFARLFEQYKDDSLKKKQEYFSDLVDMLKP